LRAETLRFTNFRNHIDTEITGFSERINVLVGPNGAGKTSVLESLSLATITKSFSTSSDVVLIRQGETELHVNAEMHSDLNVPHNVRIGIASGPPLKKTLFANNERIRSSADLVGRAPVIVLTPDDKIITSGAPAERRRFLNIVLSQALHTYLEDEIEYKRALKQRNSILNDARTQKRSLSWLKPMLEPWTEMLITIGARIMRRRLEFTREFIPFLLDAYRLLSNSRETPGIQYQPMGLDTQVSDFAELIRAQQQQLEVDELRRGTSLVGPHKDDVILEINPGHEAKHYASQGQHKTLLVSMKLAEFRYLHEATGETPILLLDDVFSELDKLRAEQLLDLAENGGFGQTFITSTDRAIFESKIDFAKGFHKLFLVERGSVTNAYQN
jgi:DNA replication and repair protein RecF